MNRRLLVEAGAAALAGAQTTPPRKARITSSVMLWTLKGSIEEKFETAAQAGLQSVELVGEHVLWSDADIQRVRKLARSLNLGIDTISATPNWKRDPVSMVDPAQRDNLLKEVSRHITAAHKLEVPMLLLMSGDAIPGQPYQAQFASLVEGAKRLGELAGRAAVTLLVEPLNTKVNHKGYFLETCSEGLRLIREVDNPHVRLLFDLYHEQVQAGDVIRTLRAAAPFVRVFHVADNPGRHEPGTGEMNYANIYKAIAATGYDGYITMEYLPTRDAVASLKQAVDEMRAAL